MWLSITVAIVLTILVFSFGANKNSPKHTKENENVRDDAGSDD